MMGNESNKFVVDEMNRMLSFSHLNFNSIDDAVKYFEANVVVINKKFLINYPPDFPIPLQAKTYNKLFDKFIDNVIDISNIIK